MTGRAGTLLVFGAGGQIGRALTERPPPRGFVIVGLGHADADIADHAAVARAVDRHRPDIIVNAAAYTAVDRAETEPARAFAVNEAGARHLATAARDAGAVLVHLSTDYVFDGSGADPYVEDAPVAPVNAYGLAKEAGERAIRDIAPRHVILRSAWIYAARGQNFLTTMLRLARERDVVRVVADQHGTPTSAADVANAIRALLPRLHDPDAAFGTFHLANSGRTTWHEFAEAIFVHLARSGSRVPRLEAIATSDYPTPARRPAMSVLDCQKIARVYGIKLRPWQDALDATLASLLAPALARGAM
jgi:dTDP-4-dehydrorhamnose reductase